MPTTITSAGITFNDATSLTSANIGTAQIADGAVNTAEIANGAVTAAKLGTTEQTRIAKAWVNFNGTGTIGQAQTIRSSYNVSSVTKNGTGDYTVNFATAMADANYSVCVNFQRSDGDGTSFIGLSQIKGSTTYNRLTTSSVNIVTTKLDQNVIDSIANFVTVFGN